LDGPDELGLHVARDGQMIARGAGHDTLLTRDHVSRWLGANTGEHSFADRILILREFHHPRTPRPRKHVELDPAPR
jgi:hypothetical protein